ASRAPPSPTGSPRRPDGGTGRRARSLPARQGFSRDLELVRLLAERPLQLSDPAALLGLQRPLLARLEPLRRRLQRLLAPLAQQALRDPMLTADLDDRAVATQRRQHDLQLLLRGELPILPLLAQPDLLLGRAAHPEPAAGRSLRRYAPPGSPGNPTQLPVNTEPGSGAVQLPAGTPSPSRSRRTLARLGR